VSSNHKYLCSSDETKVNPGSVTCLPDPLFSTSL
jgi:hypothetical protein